MKRDAPPALQHLVAALGELDEDGLLRIRPEPVPDPAATFCSNDYLGLASRGAASASAGAAASRLIVGERNEHMALERELAAWLRTDAALLFSSGYAANVGVLSALAREGDLVVSDALNHASIIDGCRLSRARVVVVPHLDLGAIDAALAARPEARAWVATESYFSMDADGPDLRALRAIADDRRAGLILDEAHAVALFGPDGRGRAAAAGVVPDVLVGTLGKALGAGGAFVAGCDPLVAWLWNRARSFVFSTGLPPAVAATALAHLSLVRRDPGLRARTLANAEQMRNGLVRLGLTPLGSGPIIPLVIGEPSRTLDAAAQLRRRGVHALAIRPPTVPVGTDRLRLTVTAHHTPDVVARALHAFEESLPWLRPSS